VGPSFSAISGRDHKPVIDAGKILISTKPGTSGFARRAYANFFVTSHQNDQIFETVGEATNKLGYKRVSVLVADFPAADDRGFGAEGGSSRNRYSP
jgi:branched-chain amino acid transport system substrate-binding protein